MSAPDEDVVMESSGSGVGTPQTSNPGTPRSLSDEVRGTPPPLAPSAVPSPVIMSASSSSVPSPAMPSHGSAPSLLALGQRHASASPQTVLPSSQSAQNLSAMAAPQPHRAHQPSQSKYAQLLAVIEDMGKDIRPTYSGSKTSAERLKRGIVHARILVRECLMECERAART